MGSLVSSLGLGWDLFRLLRSADCSSGCHEHRPAYCDSGGQEDIYATDNSSPSEYFLDPHKRDNDFLPQGSLSSPVGPHFREAAAEHAPLVAVPA